MKQSAIVLAVAAALLGSGAIVRHAFRSGTEASRETAAPFPEAPFSPTTGAPVETGRVVEIAALLSGPPPQTPAEGELARSREREARSLADRLGASCRKDPASWAPAVRSLAAVDPVETAVRIAEEMRGSADAAAEPVLIEILRSGSVARERRIALVLLRGVDSSGRHAAFLAAAADPHASVRWEALHAIGEARTRSGSSTLAATAESVLRRAKADPDPVLRSVAMSLLGEPLPPHPGVAPRRRALSLAR